MLTIESLAVDLEETSILRDLDLSINESELHVIMGPNGSGKSTLARTLAGHPNYLNYRGSIKFNEFELSRLTPDERLEEGLMLGFQHPPRIDGVKIETLLNKILDDNHDKEEKIDAALTAMDFSEPLLARNVNDGLSGGERKRLELLQARLVDPEVLVLDEPDSGVDVDSLKLISNQINYLHEGGTAILLITHYGKLLQTLATDDMMVHLLNEGKIVKSGTEKLVREVEEKGFNKIFEECGCN